jgi:TRAP-type C4-dicarboxylate transport system substrate-binding protein
LLAFAAAAGAQPAKKVLRIHTAGPNDTNVDNTKLAVEFAQNANKAASTLDVRVFPASQLDQTREVIEAMRLGSGAAMVVLGTFVDSLAILLVFAPVAVQLSKQYGIDPLQMGLVMVMCNQIGAVSPPTAPLLFVTTNIAKTTFDDTNRHV